MKWSADLRRRGLFVVSIPLVPLVAAAVAVYGVHREVRSAEAGIMRLIGLRDLSQQLLRDLMAAQISIRDDQVSGSAEMREQAESAREAARRAIVDLSRQAAEVGKPHTDRLRQLVEARLARLEQIEPGDPRHTRGVLEGQAAIDRIRA
ncbi:MAG: hypothetical protein ACRD96_25225, partial [Bryobacteraceae bacterium]